jgi:hypothetical protein
MKQDQIAIEAEIRAARFQNTNFSPPWQSSSSPNTMEKSKDKLDSWAQIDRIVRMYAEKLAERMRSEGGSYIKIVQNLYKIVQNIYRIYI